jgi:hypothetical protein
MKTKKDLADYNHPLVKRTAEILTKNERTVRGKLEILFYYVRDEIKFGILPEVDYLSASEIIKREIGACNNKGILLFALCKASDIPVRMHFSIIKKEIQRGLFKGLAYKILPNGLSHGWVEVLVDNKWRNIDSYINDQTYYLAAKKELKNRNWDTGFSVACSTGESSSDFNIDEEKFVQMDAVLEDQGVYDDPSDYLYSDKYANKVNFLKYFMLKNVIFPRVNKRVNKLRVSCSTGLCI